MGILQFLQDNGVDEGFQPELLALLDGPGAAAVTAGYGAPPGPPILPLSTLKTAVPGAVMWLMLVELDIALLIQTVQLAGSVSLMALGPPAPATPITPSAQLIQPSLLMGPLMTDVDKVLGIAKAMLEWAISLIPPGDPRLAGTFTVIKPSAPSLGSLLPALLGAAAIAAIIDAVLAGIPDSDDVDKNKIRTDMLALTAGSQPATVDEYSGFDDTVVVAVPSRGEPGSNPANDCACD